jgi:DNA-binding transcriptional MocR family regulator
MARWLLQISDRIGSADIPVTQDTIAQLLGVRRTTVTLAAQQLQQKGLIQYRRARVMITNPTVLHALACECYGACKERPDIVVKASTWT